MIEISGHRLNYRKENSHVLFTTKGYNEGRHKNVFEFVHFPEQKSSDDRRKQGGMMSLMWSEQINWLFVGSTLGTKHDRVHQ